eukprot:TRINITY_DN1467_c0_g1_i1.p1 TRINITY_DN1467_c0_g1~~TRINITY_DN1467_c0_g1_i1.p1  ORF type:complete len:519 (+),score=90.90 TRINITY_DN1467_c0_g1_i1:247-1803(+)
MVPQHRDTFRYTERNAEDNFCARFVDSSLAGWHSSEEPPENVAQTLASPAFTYIMMLEKWPVGSTAAAWCEARILEYAGQLHEESAPAAVPAATLLVTLALSLSKPSLQSLLAALMAKGFSFVGIGNALAAAHGKTLLDDRLTEPRRDSSLELVASVLHFLVAVLPEATTIDNRNAAAPGDTATSVETETVPSTVTAPVEPAAPTATYLAALLTTYEQLQPSPVEPHVRRKLEDCLALKMHEAKLQDLKRLKVSTVLDLFHVAFALTTLPSPFEDLPHMPEGREAAAMDELVLLADLYLEWAASAARDQLTVQQFCGLAMHGLASRRKDQHILIDAVAVYLKGPRADASKEICALLNCRVMNFEEVRQALAKPELEPCHKDCLLVHRHLADQKLEEQEKAMRLLKLDLQLERMTHEAQRQELEEKWQRKAEVQLRHIKGLEERVSEVTRAHRSALAGGDALGADGVASPSFSFVSQWRTPLPTRAGVVHIKNPGTRASSEEEENSTGQGFPFHKVVYR